jgi:Uma2 family endonuclease
MMIANQKATVEDLYRVEGKAELVDGELVHFMPTGDAPGFAAAEVFVSLREYARRTKRGRALTDNQAFLVNLPRRQSFSPDAAYYTGPPAGMRFFESPPDFAVEVRSEGDYGPSAERKMADKRADYFQAGTKVVWDVDLQSEDVVRKYTAESPDRPTVFRRGHIADAEPAVPEWRMPVDDLFER